LGLILKNIKGFIGMYKTFHNNQTQKGIGLFIQESNDVLGKIEVESEVDQGTIFLKFISSK
jgi:sensor histidine kinase regulating citrate/malate metabolism